MAGRHVVEVLTETNNKISEIIDKIQNESSDKKIWINDLNSIIRQLDHAVEDLEKTIIREIIMPKFHLKFILMLATIALIAAPVISDARGRAGYHGGEYRGNVNRANVNRANVNRSNVNVNRNTVNNVSAARGNYYYKGQRYNYYHNGQYYNYYNNGNYYRYYNNGAYYNYSYNGLYYLYFINGVYCNVVRNGACYR